MQEAVTQTLLVFGLLWTLTSSRELEASLSRDGSEQKWPAAALQCPLLTPVPPSEVFFDFSKTSALGCHLPKGSLKPSNSPQELLGAEVQQLSPDPSQLRLWLFSTGRLCCDTSRWVIPSLSVPAFEFQPFSLPDIPPTSSSVTRTRSDASVLLRLPDCNRFCIVLGKPPPLRHRLVKSVLRNKTKQNQQLSSIALELWTFLKHDQILHVTS